MIDKGENATLILTLITLMRRNLYQASLNPLEGLHVPIIAIQFNNHHTF